MTELGLTTSEPPEGQPIVDVWSRTSRRYRRRSVLMLVVLGLLFAGLCCFTYWLRTGDYWPWASDTYGRVLTRSLQPSGSDQITLSDFLSAPISVKDVWVHGIIMGLLLASLSSIPLLVAILYRFPFSIGFAVMVMFLAAMPWLGMTVLIGCAVTSLRPFRFSFRYASALLGLVPIAVYFVSASLEPAGSGPKLTQHRALLYAPWVLALLGSCIICAVALGIARLINYRPGGIPPVLATLFAIPVFLFHTQVGRDELAYRLLEQEIGLGARSMFRNVDVRAEAGREATRHWSRARSASYDVIYERELERAIVKVIERTESDRERAVALCTSFFEDFRNSRHVPSVLFLQGRALDQRIQRDKLVRDYHAEFRWDVPSRASRHTWEALLEQAPDHEASVIAQYKLAILNARDGGRGIDAAIELLDALTQRLGSGMAGAPPPGARDPRRALVFRTASPSSGFGMEPRVLLQQAWRLREMLAACREDDAKPYSALFGPRRGRLDVAVHPVQLLLSLDDTNPQYEANLAGIVRHFGDSQTCGYVDVRLAQLERAISLRIQRFSSAADSLAGRPAGAEALFCLGDALQADFILEESRQAFDALTKRYPESCWAQEARSRLSSLAMLEATVE